MSTLTLLSYDDFTVIGSNWTFLRASDWADWSGNVAASPPYYSAPNSLRIDPGNQPGNYYGLSTHASAQDIKEGELVLWAAEQGPGVGNAYLYIGVIGSGSTGIRVPLNASTIPTFARSRLVWYQGVDGNGDPATVYHMDVWDGSSWAVGATQYGTAMTGGTNRVGFGCTAQSLGRNKYFDDVMLWSGKAPDAISPGFIWASDESGRVKELHFISQTEVKTAILGDAGLATAKVAGHLWVEGTYLHYIDSTGDERRKEGTKEGATGKVAGHLSTEGAKLRYIDSSGDERYLPTPIAFNAKYLNEAAFNA